MQYGFGSFLSKASDIDTKKIHRLSLQALVRKIGSHPTLDQKRDIVLRRSHLQERVDTFQKQAGSMLHAVFNDADDSWGDDYTRETYTGAKFDGIGEGDDNMPNLADEGHHQTQLPRISPQEGRIDAEYILLYLPLHLGRSWCNRNAAKELVKAELHLWEGQLNDSLHHIRIALGHKSYLYRNDVRPAHTQRLKTHAWAEVHAVESTVQHHAWVYNRAQKSMLDLDAKASLLDRYKSLERQDVTIRFWPPFYFLFPSPFSSHVTLCHMVHHLTCHLTFMTTLLFRLVYCS